MNKMTFLSGSFLLLVCLLPIGANGQDTLTVYFETGSSKLAPQEEVSLSKLPFLFAIESLDSIKITGLADSVGHPEANLRLSLKRARQVQRVLRPLVGRDLLMKVEAKGEKNSGNSAKNRRVDVVIFHRPEPVEEFTDTLITEDDRCYQIDYKMLYRSRATRIKRGRKQLVVLETELYGWIRDPDHYYASRLANGKLKLKKVRWRKKRTGKGKWSRLRMTTTLPAEAFDRYKLLKLYEPPCDSCQVPMSEEPPEEVDCFQNDCHLMANFQFRKKWFSRDVYKIRAPAGYVDPEGIYISSRNRQVLHWEPRKKGRFYQAEIKAYGIYIPMIQKKTVCCAEDTTQPYCNVQFNLKCRSAIIPARAFGIEAETGVSSYANQINAYAGLALSFASPYNYSRLLSGIDRYGAWYNAFQTQFTLFDFPFDQSFISWQGPGTGFHKGGFFRTYIGTELRATFYSEQQSDRLAQDVHLGISYHPMRLYHWFSRLYLQGGVGYSYLDESGDEIYPTVQIGFNLQLHRFKSSPVKSR